MPTLTIDFTAAQATRISTAFKSVLGRETFTMADYKAWVIEHTKDVGSARRETCGATSAPAANHVRSDVTDQPHLPRRGWKGNDMWIIKPLAVALLGLPVLLLGLVLVPLGLRFRREYPETRKPFTQYPGEWMLVRMPAWLLPWDNIYDGFRGDKRGWWDNHRGGTSASLLSMWLWGATRNPANYWSRYITELDVSKCTIEKLSGNCDLPSEEPGMREWVHLRATNGNKTYDRFFMSWAITNDHGLMIDIGWKIKLIHEDMTSDTPDKDRIRGSVFTVNVWKSLT